MPVNLRKYLKQDCVLWTRTGQDTSGRPIYAPNPVQLKCRWEDGAQLLITTDGRSLVSKARVMLMRKVNAGDLLFLGTLADWRKLASYPKVPTKAEGGWEVIMPGHIPDRRGRDFFFEAHL